MHEIVLHHICCSSDTADEDANIFLGGSAALQPATQAKLTYSLIVFNEDNASPECRGDLERCTPPQTGCRTNKAERLIFNSKFQNHLSQRLPFPQQTLSNLFN